MNALSPSMFEFVFPVEKWTFTGFRLSHVTMVELLTLSQLHWRISVGAGSPEPYFLKMTCLPSIYRWPLQSMK